MASKILVLLFIAFGAVQYNDPDFYIWMPIYFIVAIVGFFAHKISKKVIAGLIIIYLIGLLFYLPDAIDWVSKGFPSITGEMQAESPFIEFIREFFGLVICVLGLLHFRKGARP